ncbi:protein translocase subunit SecA [candidate division SR1 bacterium]|nr:protein translocase subunit SecA [candidate division SR1 bacterium]
MLNWLTSLIGGDYNQKQLNQITPQIAQINERYGKFETLTDEEVQSKTEEFQNRYQNGETLDQLLPEAFAIVKQACKRIVGQEFEVKEEKQVWNMIPYDVQLLGGIVLHQGKIAEMKTGEGKTLVAAAPVYLNALSGKGVHVVTVNDYLASRDAQWIGYLYQWLGLTVGSVVKSTPLQARRGEYSKDITYVENSELGFDYLRDNLVQTMEQRHVMWRPLNFAIVDEVDSILIDEARTPLIISEAREEPTEKYQYYANIVKLLNPCTEKKKVSKGLMAEAFKGGMLGGAVGGEQEEDGDYYIDYKTKTASLSGMGIEKLEKMLNVENIYKDMGFEEIHHIENALRAKAVYINDVDYIVSNGEILIVDEHTGRTMPGRRFSEGLHQAIEAKEKVNIQRESQTMATITYQNFFKQYTKLAGMTGTATTEAEEFNKIYELEVIAVPTNRNIIRVDHNDKVYFNQAAKRKFVKDYIKFYHEIGQPILIGTADIATSEKVSQMLEKDAIVHNVLNAKFHEKEAHIVANAGRYQSVVVATNMAGRGTDIKLEAGLNEKLATNYAKWIKKQIEKGENSLECVIYSKIEYELTYQGLKEIFGLSDQQLDDLGKTGLEIGNAKITVNFNSRKNIETDRYAKISVSVSGKEVLYRDFHYGLFILGTEKHESRRIDNQLRGRAGRQGDPGVSVFFVALDDTLMKKMGGERIQMMAGMLLSKADISELELTQKQFTSAITRAQKEIEAWNFGTRKHLFDYDSVIDKQRRNVYHTRDSVIEASGDEVKKAEWLAQYQQKFLLDAQDVLSNQIQAGEASGQPLFDLLSVLEKELGLMIKTDEKIQYSQFSFDTLLEVLDRRLVEYFQNIFDNLDKDLQFRIFSEISLRILDKLWIAHIDEMQYLKDKVGFMGYAQMDPLVVYKKESFEKFQDLLSNIKIDTTTDLMRIDYLQVEQMQTAQEQFIQIAKQDPEIMRKLQEASKQGGQVRITQTANNLNNTGKDAREMIFEDEDGVEVFEVDGEKTDAVSVVSTKNKVRPNDPCPCGSGKKYKKCCGA